MQRIVSFILFLSLALGVYAGLHLFLHWRLAVGLALSPASRKLLRILLVAAALTFPLAELLGQFPWAVPIQYVGFSWLGVLSFAVVALLLEWIVNGLFTVSRPWVTAVALALSLVLSAYSLIRELLPPVIKELHLPIADLPAAESGFTIVQLSDLHLGVHSSAKRLRGIVDRVNRLQPDLVVITGDLIDRDISRFERLWRPLSQFKARLGVYAVTGNHEYYAGMERTEELARRCDIRFLNNRSVSIGEAFTLAGLEDDESRNFKGRGPDLDLALAGVGKEKPIVLLYHRPTGFARARERGVRLQLSGHTHAGQIPPNDLIVSLIFKHPFGLEREGDSWIYTTCGTGTWGPPMRLFSSSEIVRIVLHSTPHGENSEPGGGGREDHR